MGFFLNYIGTGLFTEEPVPSVTDMLRRGKVSKDQFQKFGL